MHEESFIPAQGRVLCATVSLPGLRRPPPQLSLLLHMTSANPLESTFPPVVACEPKSPRAPPHHPPKDKVAPRMVTVDCEGRGGERYAKRRQVL